MCTYDHVCGGQGVEMRRPISPLMMPTNIALIIGSNIIINIMNA